jgi:hypothetical protein
MKKVFKWGAIIVVALIVLTALFGGEGSNETTSETPEFLFSENQITEDSVRGELQGKSESGYRVELDEITKIEVTPLYREEAETLSPEEMDALPEQYAVSVFYTFDGWDNEDVMKASAGTSVEIFRRLFAHPQVVKVGTFAEQDFTDQYGKTEKSTAVKFVMERETADKVDWDGIKDRVLSDYKALYPLTDYSVHGAIQKDLE